MASEPEQEEVRLFGLPPQYTIPVHLGLTIVLGGLLSYFVIVGLKKIGLDTTPTPRRRGFYSFIPQGAAAGVPKEASSSTGAAPTLRTFTRAEVARHASEDDLWLIMKVRGTERFGVYDLTSYIPDHPGGDTILKDAGGDATRGFYGPQHPPTVHDLVPEYLIGYLEDEGTSGAADATAEESSPPDAKNKDA